MSADEQLISEVERTTAEQEERENCALFLGDLSIFCDEKDIDGAFSRFGEIVDIRIQRSKETSRALSYGFIEFAEPAAAEEALNCMNYYLLKGRPLRIRWAASRKNPVKSASTPHDSAATVYVRFLTQTSDAVVSEESLRQLFNNYGPVFDCAIKKLSQDSKTHRTKGYAFVSFDSGVLIHGGVDVAGVDSAYRASMDLANRIIDNVRYRCELGHRLHKQCAVAAIAPMTSVLTQEGVAIGVAPPAAIPVPMASAPFAPQYECSQAAPQVEYNATPAVYQSYPSTQYSQVSHQHIAPPQAPPSTPRGMSEQYQYSNYQYPFSPTAMMAALSNARSPTNYEMRQLRSAATTPRNALPVQVPAQQHYSGMYTQQGGAVQAAHVQQHPGYASCTVPLTSSGVMMQSAASTPAASPRNYQPMIMQHQVQHHMQHQVQPHMQQMYAPSPGPYMANSQYAQYQYYTTSNPGTPTNANPEMGLRAAASAEGGHINYVQTMPNGQVIVMVPMQPSLQQPYHNSVQQQPHMYQQQVGQQMQQPPQQQIQSPLTSGGYLQGFSQQIQIQTTQDSSPPLGKAYAPPTPRGSCSDYFAATKGLNLRVNVNPVSQFPGEFVQQAVQQSGSRESTPKSIYTNRKATPSAKMTMQEHRSPAQQAHMQQYMQKHPIHQHQYQQQPLVQQLKQPSQQGPTNTEEVKSLSRNGSSESMVTTSLYAHNAAPELVISSTSTDVFMPEGVSMPSVV